MNPMMMNPMMMNPLLYQFKNTNVAPESQVNWTKLRSQQSDKYSLFAGNLDSMVNKETLMNYFQKQNQKQIMKEILDQNILYQIIKIINNKSNKRNKIINIININNTNNKNRYGKIFSVRVMRNKGKGSSRGFGFVTFYNQEDMNKARKESNGQQIMENYIRVMKSVDRTNVFQNKNEQIYISNIEKSLTVLEIEEAFSVFGAVFSCKIAYGNNGQHLGYAYLQFENEEGASQAKTAKELEIKGNKVQISEFNKKMKSDNGNNLYMKNLPKDKGEQLQIIIKEKLQSEGKILSVYVQINSTFNMPFAFVCFEKSEEARRVIDKFHNTQLFEEGVSVYISQGMSKLQRKKLQEIKDKSIIKNNLFFKNISDTISESQVHTLFSQFGTITSLILQKPNKENITNPKFQSVNTQFGYVCYSSGEEATRALAEYQKDAQILDLFYNRQPYMAVHLPKEKYMQSKKKTNKSSDNNMMNFMQLFQQQMKMFANPQMFQTMMQMMMPMMNMQQQMMKNIRNPNIKMPKFNNPNSKPILNNIPIIGQQHSIIQQQQQQLQQQSFTTTQLSSNYQTPQQLKDNINVFLNLDREKQRTILGELLYPMVEKLVDNNKDTAPKITGMLIDFEVFEVSEILEFLENESQLIERITEAKELLDSSQ